MTFDLSLFIQEIAVSSSYEAADMEATENSLIEVFLCKDFIVLSRGQSSLWCCRKSGEISLGIGKNCGVRIKKDHNL